MSDFILGGSKITADGDCSHEINRHLLLGKKGMINLDSILKSTDIILPTKVHLLKNYKEIQPVHPKGDQSWVFIGRTDVEAETPILWPTDANS